MRRCLRALPGARCSCSARVKSRRGVGKVALKRLHFARAQMVGVVLNKFDMHGANYAYHTYGYGASEYYGYGGKSPPKAIAN